MKHYLASCGIAVLTGGILTFLINAGLTPFMDQSANFAETAASPLFVWRQILSAISALLLLFGSVGLHLHQRASLKLFGRITFILAFAGTAFLVANEWNQVFFVHGLALVAPDTLIELESAEGLSLFDLGALIGIFTFTVGWITFSLSMLLAKVYSRHGPLFVISGFFAIPLFTMLIPGGWGAAIGSALLGYGLFSLGRQLYRASANNTSYE